MLELFRESYKKRNKDKIITLSNLEGEFYIVDPAYILPDNIYDLLIKKIENNEIQMNDNKEANINGLSLYCFNANHTFVDNKTEKKIYEDSGMLTIIRNSPILETVDKNKPFSNFLNSRKDKYYVKIKIEADENIVVVLNNGFLKKISKGDRTIKRL